MYNIFYRHDQIIQEVYLKALKEKIGEDIQPEYLMTDDDGKYYNAWVKEIGNTPRRLLCTWHIIKNWNIKGRAKLKNQDIKSTIKNDLHNMMTATTEEEFNNQSTDLFTKLEEADESEFLSYLKKYIVSSFSYYFLINCL